MQALLCCTLAKNSVDMRYGKCKRHFMTHNLSYIETLPSAEQKKREFVAAKGNGCHISIIRMLRSGLSVVRVEGYIKEEVQEHYLKFKTNFIDLSRTSLSSEVGIGCSGREREKRSKR